MRWVLALVLIVLVAVAAWLLVPWHGAPPEIAERGDPARGEYVLRLGGCVTCHTDEKNGGALLAGGRALVSPFGTFYASNITPDPETGIGGWSTGAFVRAMTEGIAPEGHPYFPAFPYTSYTHMTQRTWSISRHTSTPSSRSPTKCPTTRSIFRSAFGPCSRAGSCCSSRTAPWRPTRTGRKRGTAAPTS